MAPPFTARLKYMSVSARTKLPALTGIGLSSAAAAAAKAHSESAAQVLFIIASSWVEAFCGGRTQASIEPAAPGGERQAVASPEWLHHEAGTSLRSKAMSQSNNPRWRQRPAGSTWGDFGADDQLGRLNLLTPEKVKQGIAEVHDGLSFCLSLPLDYPGEAKLNLRRKPPQLKPTSLHGKPFLNFAAQRTRRAQHRRHLRRPGAAEPAVLARSGTASRTSARGSTPTATASPRWCTTTATARTSTSRARATTSSSAIRATARRAPRRWASRTSPSRRSRAAAC